MIHDFIFFKRLSFCVYLSDHAWIHPSHHVPRSTPSLQVTAGASGVLLVIVGDAGAFSRSLDLGATWLEQAFTSADLLAVAFVSRTLGWVVGGQGGMFRTADGGESWELYRGASTSSGGGAGLGPVATLRGVWFADNATGFAVGDASTLLHTRDSGGARALGCFNP